MTTSSSTDAIREALRRDHQVRLVTADQEGTAADELPAGVYGFTYSPALAAPLFAVRHSRNFEIHRLANGTTAIVGFVTPSEAAELTRPDRTEISMVMVHPDAEGDATAIVSLPYERITHHKQYSVRSASAIALEISPQGRSTLMA